MYSLRETCTCEPGDVNKKDHSVIITKNWKLLKYWSVDTMYMLSCAFQWSNGIEWILGTYIINMGESQKKGAEWEKKI